MRKNVQLSMRLRMIYTATGRVEERMPLLSIIIPEHIKRKYPHIEENLQTNEKRLTSPYDLHETLMDIANSN
jgi:hypothetical protein